MKRILLFVFLIASTTLSANESDDSYSQTVLFGDSSGIVAGNVNVITGTFIDHARDLQVLGPVPIALDRFYVSTEFPKKGYSSDWCGWTIHKHGGIMRELEEIIEPVEEGNEYYTPPPPKKKNYQMDYKLPLMD